MSVKRKELEECEEKGEDRKKLAGNLTNKLVEEKNEEEGKIVRLLEKENKSLKLEIEAGKTNMKELIEKNSQISGQLEEQLEKNGNLTIVTEENIKRHEALIKTLKAQHENILKESEHEVKALKRQAGNSTSIMKKEKKEHEVKVPLLEKETSIYEEEIRSLKLQIDEGKADVKAVTARHKQIFDKLKEKLECPVCMEIPRGGPVYVCPNGHFVCKECKSWSCPTCRVDMEDGKSLLAVMVIENIEHRCKFVYCEEHFALDKIDGHEKICIHRTVSCPKDFCQEKIALSKLLDHLGRQPCSTNAVPRVLKESSKSGQVKCTLGYLHSLTNLPKSESTWKLNHFQYGDTCFVILAKKLDHFYYFTMVMLESKEECLKYNIEMEVHEFASTSQESEVSFRFSGKPCSIDEDKDDRKYLGLTVNRKGMEKIIRKNKDNSFSLSFSLVQK
eukprot:GFUD01032199.1.p1 GENE.GFUD01032199.1~~GFUD01032199.1.p1  ORF type:complete len:446 (+),score=104.74 GFUD01032199.1:53-1390(+)